MLYMAVKLCSNGVQPYNLFLDPLSILGEIPKKASTKPTLGDGFFG